MWIQNDNPSHPTKLRSSSSCVVSACKSWQQIDLKMNLPGWIYTCIFLNQQFGILSFENAKRLHPFQEIWISLQFQHVNCVALPQSQLPRIQDEDVPPDPRVNERRTTPVVNPHRLGAVETTVSQWIIKAKKRLPLHQIRIDCFFFHWPAMPWLIVHLDVRLRFAMRHRYDGRWKFLNHRLPPKLFWSMDYSFHKYRFGSNSLLSERSSNQIFFGFFGLFLWNSDETFGKKL